MKFFVQVFDEHGNLIQVSDLMPFESALVVTRVMRMFLIDYEDASRVLSFLIDGDSVDILSVISTYGCY